MGRFMIPVCVICGESPGKWHDSTWEDAGGLQDFCPKHAKLISQKYGDFVEYIVPHMRKSTGDCLTSG